MDLASAFDLNSCILNNKCFWIDTGTYDSLLNAGQCIKDIENNNRKKIACLEEIAYKQRFISKNKIQQVINLVANNYNITVEDIKSKKRLKKIAVPRQIGMYICRTHLKESLPKIGSEFGGKDHTTVMHSVGKITRELKKDKNLEIEISKIINKIK